MRLSRDLYDELVEHARREAPNECCGVVSVREDGVAARVHPLVNVAASPLKFEVGIDLADAFDAMDAEGTRLGAIYHSHTRTEPYPSPTDVNWAKNDWQDVEWIIIGLQDDEPKVRSFFIEDGRIREVGVEVA